MKKRLRGVVIHVRQCLQGHTSIKYNKCFTKRYFQCSKSRWNRHIHCWKSTKIKVQILKSTTNRHFQHSKSVTKTFQCSKSTRNRQSVIYLHNDSIGIGKTRHKIKNVWNYEHRHMKTSDIRRKSTAIAWEFRGAPCWGNTATEWCPGGGAFD